MFARPGTMIALALAVALVPTVARADVFQVVSPAFHDGDVVTSTFAFDGIGVDNTPCGGGGQSPPLAWSGAPDGTKSFAVIAFDPDGRGGLGVAHWVLYGIPPTVNVLPQGIGSAPTAPYVGGANQFGKPSFRGFCPPKGQSPHHYLLTVYALDLAPDALAPGLTRAQLLDAFNNHVLRSTSIVARYVR
jgi:Raf kinase inhibitor-like YbhB/YbcL family protein